MSKKYRPYQPKQQLMLPPYFEEWLPEDHWARVLSDVVEELELDEITAVCEREDRGYP